MIYRMGADLVVIVHLLFVLFVALGGLFAVRWARLMWLHLPALLWGALIEFAGFVCPLTPLEEGLRQRGGQNGYGGDFIGHYVVALLYPSGLTRQMQIWLGCVVLLTNSLIYGYFFMHGQHARAARRL